MVFRKLLLDDGSTDAEDDRAQGIDVFLLRAKKNADFAEGFSLVRVSA